MIQFERFEAAKIRRFVQRYSKAYHFKRPDLNAFKQLEDIFFDVCTVQAVYHEAQYSHLSEDSKDAGSYVKELSPMLLCLKDEMSDLIQVDDIVLVNGQEMKVDKIKDINNSGFAYDISLRYIDDGGTA